MEGLTLRKSSADLEGRWWGAHQGLPSPPLVSSNGNIRTPYDHWLWDFKKNATAFAEKILTELQKRNIDFTLCRGQAYSGIKSGL